jgi:hypothetical protein
MKKVEPSGHGSAQPNIDTRNIAGAGEAPRFVGPPCSESGCACEGWSDETGGGVCGTVDSATGRRCGHPAAMHH